MKVLKKYYLCSKWGLALVIAIKFISAFFDVSFSAMLYLILQATSESSDSNKFYYIATIAAGLFIGSLIFGYFEKYSTAKYCNEMERMYKQDTINNILRSDYKHFNKYSSGEYVSMIQRDIRNIYIHHFICFFDCVSCVANLVVALVYSFYLNWIITLIILALSAVIVVEPIFTMKKVEELNKKKQCSIFGVF